MRGNIIADVDTLKSVDPDKVSLYLKSQGWEEVNSIADKASIWALGDSEDQPQILLPLNRDFQDFPYRISEILKTLATIESRSQIDIFNSLIAERDDIVQIRLTHQDFRHGTIPIDNGVSLYRFARDLLLFAACSTVNPRQYFERQRPNSASEYIKHVHLGQTQHGSYTLRIHSPIRSPINGVRGANPFERRVINKLAESLDSTRLMAEKIEAARQFDVPDEIIHQGVSANLCDALLGIHKSGRKNGLEISLSYSSSIPAPENISRRFIFESVTMKGVAKLAKRLRAEVHPDFEVNGEVVKLERYRGKSSGLVTLLAQIDGRSRKIKVMLENHEYELATTAHQTRSTIVCNGRLVKEGHIFTLLDPRNFRIL